MNHLKLDIKRRNYQFFRNVFSF